MRSISAWSLALSAGLFACHPTATFIARGGVCPAHPHDCAFELISGKPERDYQTIGVIEVESFNLRSIPKNDADFRKAIGPAVCKAGGDAVVAGVNGDGRYVLANIVKWVDSPDAAAPCPKSLPDAGAADGGPGKAKTSTPAVTDAAVPAPPDTSTPSPLSYVPRSQRSFARARNRQVQAWLAGATC